jgi:hypothetical protein
MNRKLYAELEAAILRVLATSRQIHGSAVVDLWLQTYPGWIVDTRPEDLLRDLVADGVLVPLERAPTASQAAWAGLQYFHKSYERLPWGPGVATHHWYALATERAA